MAQRLTTSFVNTVRPGAYFEQNVRSTPVGVASSGNIVIVGEASGGAYFADESLKDNFFTPDQLDRVVQKYISGPIVDAFRALSASSADADITGSPSRIYIAKTNDGSKAEAVIANSYGTLSDKNFGIDGNKYFYQVTQLADEVGPSVSGDTIPSLGAGLTGVEFRVRVRGGVETLINPFTGPSGDYDTIAEVVALLDAALPAGLSCVLGTASNSVKIEADVDVNANSAGDGKSFELIEVNVGDLLALGLEEGMYVSSQEPQVQLDIKRTDTNVNESFIVDAEVALSIGYQGTTATATVNATHLTTTVTGGSGANLNIKLADFATMKDLADFINTQTGYSCSVASNSGQLSPSALDQVSTIGICTTGALQAGRIKKALFNFESKVGQSNVLDFESTAVRGLPAEMSSVAYLTGGAKGGTLAINVVDAVTACETINVNFVVPLFSQNATQDISEGLTESSSTYTISAVNAVVKSHVLKMSTSKIKKHRTAFLSFWDGTFSGVRAEASSLANARISCAMQKPSQVNSVGVIVKFLPWYSACIAAGMQAAGFYKAIFNKFANIISFEDPSGFDSGSHGDIETGIESGLLFFEKAIVGNKWVSDQTTYGVDTNFVYNSIQAMYSADLVALDLTDSFQTAFVGKSLADVDAATGLSFLSSKMDSYKKQKLISASDDAPLGFRNAKVSINGPIMTVSVEIKLATAIYFIPISIEISQVQNTAA